MSLRRWWRREEKEANLERELRFHIEERVADMVRSGVSEEHARRRVRMEFGAAEQAFARALEASGLVRLEKNRGVFVRQISVDEADEIYEVRAALDQASPEKKSRKGDRA